MNAKPINQLQSRNQLLFPLISSILLTMFLFFIDEGYYNFKWMGSIVNWICFAIYSTGIFVGQYAMRTLCFKNQSGLKWDMLTFILGGSVGLLLTLIIVFGVRF